MSVYKVGVEVAELFAASGVHGPSFKVHKHPAKIGSGGDPQLSQPTFQ